MRSGALSSVVPATVLLAASAVSPLYSQTCETRVARTAPQDVQGKVIRSLVVRTEAPLSLPIAGEQLAALRRTTETRVVRHQLLFSPDERADSVIISETLRRLRSQRLYADVALEIRSCLNSDSVDLTLLTRDAYTLRPILRLVPPNTVSLGLEDRNLLGTSQSVLVSREQAPRGRGGTAAYTDPWLLGTNILAGFRVSDVAGDHSLRVFARHHERSDFEPWRAEASYTQQSYSSTAQRPVRGQSLYATAEIGHLVGHSRLSVTIPYIGFELDSIKRARVLPSGVLDSAVPARSFAGVELGLLRRTVRFDTLTWFVPDQSLLDIPMGLEGDVVITAGRDLAQKANAAHYDGWVGRMWIPRRGQLVTTDAWGSGFIGNVRPNRIDRATITTYGETVRGYWGARIMLENLLSLDADVRFLSQANITNDPSLPSVPQKFRNASRSLTGYIERAVHLHYLGRGSMLDAALFGAGSLRWDAPGAADTTFGVGVIGARLRVLTATGVISSARLDLIYPVAMHGRGGVRRPQLSVSVAPLFDAYRQRDSKRRQ